jgi:hypothetical protein
MIGNYRRLEEARLEQLLASPEALSGYLYPETEKHPGRYLDIDKSWHIIHFLLNGKTWEGEWPLVAAVLGGAVVSDVDVGYGPARYLMPAEVAEVSAALAEVPASTLLQRWDSEAIAAAEIYPQAWAGQADDLEYVGSNYEALCRFFAEAAARDEAMILYIN